MKVIGLMSGTSVDGIDVALCEITGTPQDLQARVLKAGSVTYERVFRERVLAVCDDGRVDEICRLNVAVAEHFVTAIEQVIGDLVGVDLIGSHGQTIWHDIDVSGNVTATLQIGTAAVIAERTGITTINNFRERDVAAGGQGAPLTAYIDWLLLRHPTEWRAVQNIGGMGNVTFLPPRNNADAPMIAFDTGPGNVLIDAAIDLLSGGALTYDVDGAAASRGQVDEAWLNILLTHPYYRQPPPRTTGRELFSRHMARELLEAGVTRGLMGDDILATLTALTAASIASAYRDYAPRLPTEVIVGGGGSRNRTLMQMLARRLSTAQVMDHEAIGLSSDYKEALVFAVLAYETWHNRIGCLPSQTGAHHSTVLGQITPGTNYQELIRRTW
ncbi:MAG: anhydro-N-acetylmuramic acid kinase [Chloroflexota bacterium]